MKRRSASLTFSPADVRDYYYARLPDLKQTNAREWRGACPVHGGKDPNFAVNSETGDWFCHSKCTRGGNIIELERALLKVDFNSATQSVFQIVGRPAAKGAGRRIVAEYDYTDEAGTLLFQCVRYEPKGFAQRRPDRRGGWIWDLKDTRLVPYRLAKVLPADTVYVCEGEKDVHTLESFGLVATCNAMGAGKWRPEYSEHLRGKHVIILPDADEPGRKHALTVAASLLPVAASVRVVELPDAKDASAWREVGGTREQLEELARVASPLDAGALSGLRARWLLADEDAKQRTAAVMSDEWPDPVPIQSELPPVEPFGEGLLPESLRPYVRDVAHLMQVPIDYPAAAVVVALAGAVNRRARIQPKAVDDTWLVVPNLWGGIIAPPGYLKSPVLQIATEGLTEIQSEWFQDYQVALAEYKEALEEWELRQAAWKEEFKRLTKKKQPPEPRPSAAPEEPTLRRLLVNDATFEALHKTLSENPSGILVVRDELPGWWSTLDRQGREGERAFCLEAWNGDKGFTVDRISRGTIHVEACCMSMLGGIQPGRLRCYLSDALADGPTNDGLIQRFQVMVWADVNPEWKLVDRKPDMEAKGRMKKIFRRLVELPAEKPMRFKFSPDAQQLFEHWWSELEAKVRGEELHAALISHLSKYRSLMPTLAVLFELADRAAEGFVGFEGLAQEKSHIIHEVSLDHARQAAAWCHYLESHARRIYSCVTTPQLRAARELAEKIRQRKVGADGTFSCRDVYLKEWSGLDSPEAVKLATEILQDAGWLRKLAHGPAPSGGRPSDRFAVNPRVRE